MGTLFQDMQECGALARQSGTLDKAVYESCMLRKGFQKTGESSYSRTTGVNPAVALAIATVAVPAIGTVLPAVSKTAEQIGAKPPSVAPKGGNIATPAAAPQSAPSGGTSYGLDSKTLLLLGLGALVFLFAARN